MLLKFRPVATDMWGLIPQQVLNVHMKWYAMVKLVLGMHFIT